MLKENAINCSDFSGSDSFKWLSVLCQFSAVSSGINAGKTRGWQLFPHHQAGAATQNLDSGNLRDGSTEVECGGRIKSSGDAEILTLGGGRSVGQAGI